MSDSKIRGGQPGNLNARTHGFYSLQRPLIATSVPDPLLDFNTELAQLHDNCSYLIGLLKETTDPEAIHSLQRAINLCTLSICRLTRLHLINNPSETLHQQAVARMTSLMRQDLALPETDESPLAPPREK